MLGSYASTARLCCSSSMHPTTNPLLLLIIISTASFFAGGSLQPLHRHGGGCIPAERAALLSFKKGINADPANRLASWRGRDCCRWRGVTCSNRTSHVLELHLRNPNPSIIYLPVCLGANALVGDALFGEISPSLLSLEHLEHMDLSMNCLIRPSNHIPEFLGLMENLRYLNLSGIPFVGRVPPQFGNLSKLQYLDLGDGNGFSETYSTDITWLTNLPLLQYLSMSNVNLTGIADWPRILNMLPSLRVIRLHGCSLHNASQSLPHLNLTKLEKLDLSWNSLDHPIASSWFWKATSLKHLNLQGSRLFGQFPDALGNMTSLQVLDMSYNSFNGTLPNLIGHLTSLTTLDLSSNLFSGIVPSEIGALTNLTSLDLSKNTFSGVIKEKHFASLVSLKNIDLSSSNVKIVVDSNWVPPFMLESALFASCQMGPLFPGWLQRQLKITELDISSTALKDKIPDWFWSTFSQATYVDISNNALSGTLPSNLEAPRLQTFVVYLNQIGGSIPESICKLQQLVDLDMSSNLFEGEIPQCFETESMKYLLLSNNNLSGKFPAFLQNFKYLQFLDLSWNKFSGRLPTWIGELTNLRFLRLSHNAFFGSIPVEITNLSHLQYLDLASNNISGVIPWPLSNLTGMTMKGFRPISGTDEGPAGLGSVTVIDQFGEIMSTIIEGQQLRFGGTLVYFVSIDLSGNSLIGEIPMDITSLDALINLNLSSNQLSGNIPNEIGSLQSLESVDLSKNKLYGEIPSSLSSLTSLSYLNLSYNNLSGRIPSGRQLDTLNADNPSLIYIGNSGLCGPPLQKNCSGNDTVIHGYLRSNKQEFELMTFYFGLVVGLVVGLWMVFCALLFKKTWRIAYFRLFDKLYDKIYVFVAVNWASLARKAPPE